MFYALVTMRDSEIHALICSSASLTAGELVLKGRQEDGWSALKTVFDLALTREIEVRCLRSGVPVIHESAPFPERLD